MDETEHRLAQDIVIFLGQWQDEVSQEYRRSMARWTVAGKRRSGQKDFTMAQESAMT